MVRIIAAAARLLSHVAAIALLAMVAINVIDVGMRSVLNAPIFGAFEIVELLLAVVAFLVIPEAFLRDSHITVELIDTVVPPAAVAWLKAIGMATTVLFLALLSWFMITPAVDFVRFDEVTFSLHIPKIYEAAPVLIGIVCSLVAALVIFVRDVRNATRGGPAR